MVVIDPPFITEDVWELYATAAKLLLSKRGKLMLTTIAEHEQWLKELLGVHRAAYRPSIPNLIYQYSLYINYPSQIMSDLNPEIGTNIPSFTRISFCTNIWPHSRCTEAHTHAPRLSL
jgi:hypothetical protein